MIKYELPFPIYTVKQVSKIGEAIGQRNAELISKHWAAYNPKNGEFEEPDEEKTRSREQLIGSEALKYLAEKNGIKAKPVTEVNIKRDVLLESSNEQWLDICGAEFRLEERCERYEKLIKLNCPLIILKNEARIIVDYFNILESNPQKVKWERNGKIIKSLKDVGYTLEMQGFEAWKRNEIRERNERYEQEMEEEANRSGAANLLKELQARALKKAGT